MDGERQAGGPGILFHGSDREFEAPRPLTHFGSREAALAAPRSRGVLMAFLVTVERPLEVPDECGGGDTWYWLRSAVERGIVSEADFSAWELRCDDAGAVRLLEAAGYDGLVYVNRFEDEGSLSWVVFRPEQAVRLPLPPEDEPTAPAGPRR